MDRTAGALKYLNPVLPSMRQVCLVNRKILWDGKPIRSLLHNSMRLTGRNAHGQLILYTRCSTQKKWIRNINHSRKEYGVPGLVIRIEYDPRRSAFISLVHQKTGEIYYTIHTDGLMLGCMVTSYKNIVGWRIWKLGDRVPIRILPHGSIVHSVESFIGSGASYFRSAGTYAIVLKRYIHLRKSLIKFKSGCLRLLPFMSEATIGMVSNKDFRYIRLGKAGRNIWLGRKPCVRGVAMNPIDHPHGGGNGKKAKPVDPKSYCGRVFKWRATARIFKRNAYANERRI